jgi:hypothetical protein
MRKTLLIAAATLAAGVIAAQADSPVYSQNIVGYANLTVPVGGYALLSSPFDASDSTGATNNSALYVFPNVTADPSNGGGPLDGSELMMYNGAGYDTYYFDSNTNDTTTGFTDSNGNQKAAPILAAGKGFYFNNQSATTNITVVGTVRGATSTGVFYTNTIGTTSMFYLVGSPIPVAGDLQTNMGLLNYTSDPANGGGPLDGTEIQIPIYTAGQANISGYQNYYFDSNTNDTTTGFTDSNGNPLPAPKIKVGQGFFISNQTGGNYPWVQNITF